MSLFLDNLCGNLAIVSMICIIKPHIFFKPVVAGKMSFFLTATERQTHVVNKRDRLSHTKLPRVTPWHTLTAGFLKLTSTNMT